MMKIELANKEKISMIFLGKTSDGKSIDFFYDTGEIEVDLGTLSAEQKNQLVYNCRRGVLKVDSFEELIKSAQGLPAVSKTFSTPTENPIVKATKSFISAVSKGAEEHRTEMRNLLKEKINIIKQKTKDMSISQIKDLLEMEKTWKNRKAIVALLEEKVNEHARAVLNITGDKDIAGMTHIPNPNKLDDQFTITDSEVQEVEIKVPGDD